MSEQKSSIYRKESLERLSSPERLDRLMEIVSPQDWLSLATLGGLVVLGVIWSILGRIPIAVQGQGLLMRPRRVVEVQSPVSGQLQELQGKVGDCLGKDNSIALINLSHIQKSLGDRANPRESLQQLLRDTEALNPRLKNQIVAILDRERNLWQTSLSKSEIEDKLQQLELDRNQAQQLYLENLLKIGEIKGWLQELDSNRKRPAEPNLPGAVPQQVEQLDGQIKASSAIKSQHNGCILEVKASPGQIVSAGTPIATMLVEASSEPIVAIIYFTLKDGKKIKPGMEIQITPDTVERSRFGAILGQITSVLPFPVTKDKITSIARNDDVIASLIGEEVKIEAIAQLELDPDSFSGYKWTSSGGPNLEITSGTTTTVRVLIEERAPITFVLPFLREWSGIN